MTQNSQISLIKIVPVEFNQTRLDLALSNLLPEYSRAKLQEWIKAGFVTVDNVVLRAKDKVRTDQVININATVTTETTDQPQAIALDIVYEDQDIIVTNKPAGLVTHPGAGRTDNTLLNALLYRYPELTNLPRAGIIHRLDKDTSGLLVIAHNLIAHTKLVADLQNRKIKREYAAIVNGVMTTGGTIEAPIGRHPFKRTHMAVKENGKSAITHYRVIKRFPAHTYLKVILETGRTHQIRVHLAHIGYPIVGDPTYGKGLKIPAKCSEALRQTLMNFKRQALHAERLGLKHPRTGQLMEWEVKPPEDMEKLLQSLGDS
jgi:23S rRNA pseudouridine1911/1915/1917 synthase